MQEALRSLPSVASHFVLSLGENAISYIPTSVSNFAGVATSKSAAFLASSTTKNAFTGATILGVGLLVIAAAIKYVALPIIKMISAQVSSAATSAKTKINNAATYLAGKASAAYESTSGTVTNAFATAKRRFTRTLA